MSRTFHRLFLDHLIPRSWSDDNPPILLNSWEAKYFHVNHVNIVDMARHVRRNFLIYDFFLLTFLILCIHTVYLGFEGWN
jgi:alpha-galactosidase